MDTALDPALPAALAAAAAIAPGAFGFALSRALGLQAIAARRVAAMAAAGALGATVAACIAHAMAAPGSASRLVLGGDALATLGLGARFDGLTALMLVTVTIVGSAVTRYAIRYLDGDPGQARFCQWVSYTLSAVLILAVSDGLGVLFAGWLGTSHGLHRLLTHFGDRPAAQLAAHKKFLVSRLGDAMLVAAFVAIAFEAGSLALDDVFAALASAPEATLVPIALLLVAGAMTKSAQFPFHTWLPDSLETPTPVSALMHAGIINAGGFLLLRMSPIVAEVPVALAALASGGAVTALVGSVSMLTQTEIKRKYAWSTVSQMGFMMMQCGLGAFGAAALHLVGHAFYKAHAFLASGTAVDPDPPGAWSHERVRPRGRLPVVAALVGGLAIVGGVLLAAGIDPAAKPGLPVLGTILALAVAQLLLLPRAADEPAGPSLARGVVVGATFTGVYLAGVAVFDRILASSVAAPAVPGDGLAIVWLACVALFALAFALQWIVAGSPDGRVARALFVHAQNGFYLSTVQDRLVARIWPPPGRGRLHVDSPSPNPSHAEGVTS